MIRFLRQVRMLIARTLEWLRTHSPWRHVNNLSKERPPGWNESRLGPFLESMWSNTIATFANFGEAQRARDVDALFGHFVENASRVKNKAAVAVGLPLLLVIRAHAAFRAGASLALAGAIPEAMAALRLCLETAGYAAMMQGNETLSMVWLNRGNSSDAKNAARRAFRHAGVHESLVHRDAKIAEIYDQLYEYLIDGGAHPNELGLMQSLQVENLSDGGARLTQMYLQADTKVLQYGVRAISKVGVCALMIFETMYSDEFQELGITQKLPQVRQGL